MYFLAYVGSNKVKDLPLHYVLPASVRMTIPVIMMPTNAITRNLVNTIIPLCEMNFLNHPKRFKN